MIPYWAQLILRGTHADVRPFTTIHRFTRVISFLVHMWELIDLLYFYYFTLWINKICFFSLFYQAKELFV